MGRTGVVGARGRRDELLELALGEAVRAEEEHVLAEVRQPWELGRVREVPDPHVHAGRSLGRGRVRGEQHAQAVGQQQAAVRARVERRRVDLELGCGPGGYPRRGHCRCGEGWQRRQRGEAKERREHRATSRRGLRSARALLPSGSPGLLAAARTRRQVGRRPHSFSSGRLSVSSCPCLCRLLSASTSRLLHASPAVVTSWPPRCRRGGHSCLLGDF